MGNLIGRLVFDETYISGGFSRPQPRPLYKKAYARGYAEALDPSEGGFRAAAFGVTFFEAENPTPLRSNSRLCRLHRRGILIWKNCRLSTHSWPGPAVNILLESRAPDFRVKTLRRGNTIVGMEMLAP